MDLLFSSGFRDKLRFVPFIDENITKSPGKQSTKQHSEYIQRQQEQQQQIVYVIIRMYRIDSNRT